MHTQEEFEKFREWYQKLGAARPVWDSRAHARLGVPNKKGKIKRKPFAFGTVMIWPDGLVFLHKRKPMSIWQSLVVVVGFALIVALVVVTYWLTGKKESGSLGVLVLGLLAVDRYFRKRKMKLDSVAAVMHAADSPRSAFVPLARITAVERCWSLGVVVPDHLRIVYTDPQLGERQVIFGELGFPDKIGFDADMLRGTLESCMRRAAEPAVSAAGEKTVPPQVF